MTAGSAGPASPGADAPSRQRGSWLPTVGGYVSTLRGFLRGLLDRPLTSYHLLLGSMALLIALGLPMVLSASSVTTYAQTGSSFGIFVHQAVFVAAGLPLTWGASRIPPRIYRRLAYPAMFAVLVGLCLVFVPGIGEAANGARSWIGLGPIQIQPSEPAKIALAVWGADLLARKERLKLLEEWRHILIPLLPGTGLIAFLIMMGNDFGTTVIFLSIFLALLWVAGVPARLFAGMLGLTAFSGSLLIMTAEHRINRLTTFLHPFAEANGDGLQTVQGIYALATGGLWGVGLGASREKWSYLPYAHTDFIFAIIGEELGLVGTLAVLVLFSLLGYAGLRVAWRAKDTFIRLAAAGTTTWIIVQACVNIGAVLGVLPVTGLPLPLISYGGSSLLTTMVAVGMLLSFARCEPGAARALAARGPSLLARGAGWLGLRRGR